MEVKQEPDDLFSREQEIDIQEHFFSNEIVKENWFIDKNKTQISNVIKQENCNDPSTNHLLQTCINPKSETNPIINGADIKCNLVQINDIKQSRKGRSLNGKYIKTQKQSHGIIICAICGYLYTKHVEYLSHYSIHHSLRKKKLHKNPFNRRNTGNLTKLNEDVKYDIQIVKNEPNGELAENRNSSQFNGTKNYKPYSREIVENAQLSCKKQFKCDICSKSFTQKGTLTIHLRYHTGELFRCEICAKAFSLKSNLDKHLRCHTGEKPYKCEICLKSFSQKGTLTFHLRSHTGEKPFKCDICLKSFLRKSDFTVHLRFHTGELFKCEVCSKPFSSKSVLNQHLLCHAVEKRFRCEICFKEFSRKSGLKEHSRSHTGERPFKCDICLKSFTTKSHLNRHLPCHSGKTI